MTNIQTFEYASFNHSGIQIFEYILICGVQHYWRFKMSHIEAKSIDKCLKYNTKQSLWIDSMSACFSPYLSHLSRDFVSIWVILKPGTHLNDLQAVIWMSKYSFAAELIRIFKLFTGNPIHGAQTRLVSCGPSDRRTVQSHYGTGFHILHTHDHPRHECVFQIPRPTHFTRGPIKTLDGHIALCSLHSPLNTVSQHVFLQ